MQNHAGRILAWQCGSIGAAAILAGEILGGWGAAGAVLYGGAAAVLNSGLLWWRWWRGSKRIHSDPGRHLKTYYRSSLERFFVVGIWLTVGFTMLGLQPLPQLSGFVVGQLAWIGASLFQRERA